MKGFLSSIAAALAAAAAHGSTVGLSLEAPVSSWDDGDALLSMRVPEGVSFASKSFVRNPSFDKLGGYPEPVESIDAGEARRSRPAPVARSGFASAQYFCRVFKADTGLTAESWRAQNNARR